MNPWRQVVHIEHSEGPKGGEYWWLKAEGWPLVNADGFFKVSPTTAFGVDCRECHAVYVLRPQAE